MERRKFTSWTSGLWKVDAAASLLPHTRLAYCLLAGVRTSWLGKVVELAEAARLSTKKGPLLTCYMASRRDLIRFLTARTGSAPDAEDILQDVYVRLCNLSAEMNEADIADPKAYLYRLCLNAASDYRRVQMRRTRRDDAYQRLHVRMEKGETAADSPSPEAQTEFRLRLERILVALEALPSQQRRVFRMHRIQGLSHREISDILGISRSAVEKHMIAALKRLATWQA